MTHTQLNINTEKSHRVSNQQPCSDETFNAVPGGGRERSSLDSTHLRVPASLSVWDVNCFMDEAKC